MEGWIPRRWQRPEEGQEQYDLVVKDGRVLKRKKERENELKTREVELRGETDGSIKGGMDGGRGEQKGWMWGGWLRDWYEVMHCFLLLLSVFACLREWAVLPSLSPQTLIVTPSGYQSQTLQMNLNASCVKKRDTHCWIKQNLLLQNNSSHKTKEHDQHLRCYYSYCNRLLGGKFIPQKWYKKYNCAYRFSDVKSRNEFYLFSAFQKRQIVVNLLLMYM